MSSFDRQKQWLNKFGNAPQSAEQTPASSSSQNRMNAWNQLTGNIQDKELQAGMNFAEESKNAVRIRNTLDTIKKRAMQFEQQPQAKPKPVTPKQTAKPSQPPPQTMNPQLQAEKDFLPKLVGMLSESTKQKLIKGQPFFGYETKITTKDKTGKVVQEQTNPKFIRNGIEFSESKNSLFPFMENVKVTNNPVNPTSEMSKNQQYQIYDYINSYFQGNKQNIRDAIAYIEQENEKKTNRLLYGKDKPNLTDKLATGAAGVTSAATLGLSNLAFPEEKRAALQQKGAFQVGEFVGSVAPIIGLTKASRAGLVKAAPNKFALTEAEKAMLSLPKQQQAVKTIVPKNKAILDSAKGKQANLNIASDTIAGTAYGAGQEVADAAFDTRGDKEQTLAQRLGRVYLDTATGLGIGAALEGLPMAVKSIGLAKTQKKEVQAIDKLLESGETKDLDILTTLEQASAKDVLTAEENLRQGALENFNEQDMATLQNQLNVARQVHSEHTDLMDAINARHQQKSGTADVLVQKTDLQAERARIEAERVKPAEIPAESAPVVTTATVPDAPLPKPRRTRKPKPTATAEPTTTELPTAPETPPIRPDELPTARPAEPVVKPAEPVATTKPFASLTNDEVVAEVDRLIEKNNTGTLTPEEQALIDSEVGATSFTSTKTETFYQFLAKDRAMKDGKYVPIEGTPVDLGYGIEGFIHVVKEGATSRAKTIRVIEAKSGFMVAKIEIKQGKAINYYNQALNQAKLRIRKTMAERNDVDAVNKAIQELIDKNGISPRYADEAVGAPKEDNPLNTVDDGTQASVAPDMLNGLPKNQADGYYGSEFTGTVEGRTMSYPDTGARVSRKQVIQNIKKRFGVAIGTGLIKSLRKKALGVFVKKSEVIRTQIADDMFVIAHELGHWLDKKFNLQLPEFRDEMIAMWRKVFPGGTRSYKPEQYYAEAVAEFIRVYLISPADAERLAPNFFKYFESNLDKQMLDKLQMTHQDFRTWIGQGAYEQASSMIDYLQDYNRSRGDLRSIYATFVDRLDAVKRTNEEAEKLLNSELDAIEKNDPELYKMIENEEETLADFESMMRMLQQSLTSGFQLDDAMLAYFERLSKAREVIGKIRAVENFYMNARLTYGAQSKAEAIINYGFMDNNGEIKAEGLMQILSDLKTLGIDYKELNEYAVAVHLKYLRDTYGKKIPYSNEQLNRLLDLKNKYPEIEQMRERLVAYNQNLLDMLADGGRISKSFARELKKKYPFYVPLFRVMDDDYSFGRTGGGAARGGESFVDLNTPLRTMSEAGSTRDIINPLESIIAQTHLYVNQVEKNRVGMALDDLSKIEGFGNIVEMMPSSIYYQRFSQAKRAVDHIVTIYKDGQEIIVKINDPELFRALKGMDESTANPVIQLFGKFTNMLKIGATATPEFALRNPIRDALTAMIYTGASPLKFIKGLKSVATKDKRYQQFLQFGGKTSFDMTMTREVSKESLDSLLNAQKSIVERLIGKGKTGGDFILHILGMLSGIKPFYRAFQGIHHLSDLSDQIIRVGVFEDTLRKTGDFRKAAFQARDIMDFNRAGYFGKEANKVVAFFNASVQGIDGLFRYAAKNPVKFMIRGFTYLTIPTMALKQWNYMMMDEEAKKQYDQIDSWQKNLFFIIYNPAGNNFIRLPKPYGLSFIFCEPAERLYDSMFMNKKNAATDDLWDSFKRQFLPPFLPQMIAPLLEYMTGYSLFKGYDTIPADEKNLENKDQYGMNTSLTARAVSKGLDAIGVQDDTPMIGGLKSPRMFDQTLYGLTAGMGKYATDIIDNAILRPSGLFNKDTALPAKKWTEMPVARGFFVNTSSMAKQTKDFYDLYNKVNKSKNSAKFNQEFYLPRKGDTAFERYPIEYQYEVLNSFKKQIDEYNGYRKMIESADISGEEKRKQLDKIQAVIDSIALAGLKAAGKE